LSIKEIFFSVLFWLIPFCFLYAQKADTIINKDIYKSYYSYSVKQPLYVTYSLYKGGGDCDRETEGFEFDNCGIKLSATDADYSKSGYEKGHLVNAEDFAFDCEKEEKTFCYYNCIPQTGKLNKGIWKKWETKARNLSQHRKIFIVAGAIYGKKTIGENKIGVPDYCYKIILVSKTREILYCLLFKNDESNTVSEITLAELKKKLKYPLVP
jgi:endonuclease G